MDRKFIIIFLAKELLKEKVTTVGTMRSDRRDLPTELRPVSLKNAQPGTVRFAFAEDTTLVSNVPKKGKVVTVLCTQHCNMKVTDDKPDIILFYNSTKAGVDVLDKCIRTYSCCRGTRRRQMAVLFNLIDIAAYNAYILFRETNDQWAKQYKKKKKRILEGESF
ncbi:hypothetical protein ANN_19103 [Periplaneta americana]|uniref:PiggyBac transposable element-derived protein domain-containing protein n=1 Tax=Periplaneta americana TaxID=6978 RepID=A0ABQ8S9U6_PERAM|nr:hypothetical protein ANN_19103 [Periplaneta americana]